MKGTARVFHIQPTLVIRINSSSQKKKKKKNISNTSCNEYAGNHILTFRLKNRKRRSWKPLSNPKIKKKKKKKTKAGNYHT